MNSIKRLAFAVLASTLLAGCSATTSFTAIQAPSTIQVKEMTGTATIPSTETFGTTTFGNYEFKVESPGLEPFYGVLPLNLNGGHIALDILLFCPALFFNIREVFPEYEFDVTERVVRYRKKPTQPWVEYRPTAAETSRAQRFFGSPTAH